MRVVCCERLKRDSQRALPFKQLFYNGLQQRSLEYQVTIHYNDSSYFTIFEYKFIKMEIIENEIYLFQVNKY